jgi:SAM-dependent methyltransferase
MVEFTGERVVPGQVEPDLWNEHLARYAFAARFAEGRRVLDAGCGAGYGSAELARVAASVTGLDLSPEAIEWARQHYAAPALVTFLNGSCAMLPFRAGAFDLVVAFELIEHLHQQTSFLAECRRVLAPDGLLIVSTPNTLYYAEARAAAGPNPFHEHEFEAAEFEAALRAWFANVSLLLQNRSECFAFYPPSGWHGGETIAEPGADRAEEANFFVALCSNAPLPAFEPLVYVPRVANLLRERERHIEKLRSELTQKERWLAEVTAERDQALELARETETALQQSNRWAEQVSADLAAARERIVELQAHFAAEQQRAQESINRLEAQLERSNRWAEQVSADLAAAGERIVELQEYFAAEQLRAQESIDGLEAENQKKTEWALKLAGEVDNLSAQIAMVIASRWVRAGHKIGMGPPLPGLDKPAQ